MSESLSFLSGGGSGGGGGGGGGVIWLFLFVELSSMELSFSSLFLLRPAVGQCRLLLSMSNCNYLSAVLNFLCSPKLYLVGGVLLHVSVKLSGYFGWRVLLER